jgi:hypothetical protein
MKWIQSDLAVTSLPLTLSEAKLNELTMEYERENILLDYFADQYSLQQYYDELVRLSVEN